MSTEIEADPARYLGVLREAFDRHYAERSDVWTTDAEMRAFPAMVQGYLVLPPESRVLDVGCGAGRDVAWFAQAFAEAVGIDLHAHADWPAVSAGHPNARFIAGDPMELGEALPVGQFQLVFDNGCFHHQHPTRYGVWLRHMRALLAPGGTYVLSTFKNAAISGKIDPYGRLHRYFADEELREVLAEAGLNVVHALDVWRLRHGDFYRLTFARPEGG